MRTMILLLLLAGCAGQDRYEMEARAYADLLVAEVNAGRMTDAQAKYLMVQKANQLVNQKNANDAASSASTVNALGIYNQMSRPASNTINCTTFQRGQFGNINCQ